jgi:hypothetical protein
MAVHPTLTWAAKIDPAMMSRPVIRELLFFLSLFYVVETHFVSEQSKLSIDLEEQSFTIEFQDLQTPKKQYDHAVRDLAVVDTAENRLAMSPGFEFDTLYFFEVEDHLNAHLGFHFSNPDNLFEMFNIREDTAGNRIFAPLENEKITASNGTIKNTPQMPPTVYWEAKEQQLEVSVKQTGAGAAKGSTKSLLPTWKKWKQK